MEKTTPEPEQQLSFSDYSFEEKDDPRTYFDSPKQQELVADMDYEKSRPVDDIYDEENLKYSRKTRIGRAEILSDKLGVSTNEALRYVDLSEDDEDFFAPKNFNRKEQQGPENKALSVNSDDRKSALEFIMSAYNSLNKLKGAASDSGKKAMQNRYPGQELNNINNRSMDKASFLKYEIGRHIDVLMGGSEVAKEFPSERARLENELSDRYGVGKAYALDRKKFADGLYDPKKEVKQK